MISSSHQTGRYYVRLPPVGPKAEAEAEDRPVESEREKTPQERKSNEE